MKPSMPFLALAALLAVGVMGCETYGPFHPVRSTSEPAVRPAFLAQSTMIEGQVVRNEGDAYVIKEPSGRQTRVFFDRNTLRDNITVGDAVVARYDGPPSSAYATSITRRTSTSLPPPSASSTLPRSQTVEGLSSGKTATIT